MTATAREVEVNAAMKLSGALDSQETIAFRLRDLVDQIENSLLGTGIPDRNEKDEPSPHITGLIPRASARVTDANKMISDCNDRLYHICNELGVVSKLTKRIEE